MQLEAEPQKRARDEASSRGEVLLGMAPTIKNKVLFTAFVTAQVKVRCVGPLRRDVFSLRLFQSMSLLAYIIRAPNAGGTPEIIKQNQELLPQLSIRLLQDIPMEAPGVRKVRTTHISDTPF